MSKKKKKPSWVKQYAKKRIEELMKQADSNKFLHPERSRRYSELAFKLSEKYKVPLGKNKHKFCKNCFTYFTVNNMKLRKLPKKNLFKITCLHCGYQKIVGIGEKKKFKSELK